MSIRQVPQHIRQFLNHPRKVFFTSVGILFLTLLLNGNLWRLWSLHSDFHVISENMQNVRQDIAHLDKQLSQAKDPSYIERQAKDRLDLVGEHDLVFVFSE